MGCSTSITSSVLEVCTSRQDGRQCSSTEPRLPTVTFLSDQHKKIVVKNWHLLSNDLTGRGSRIFLLIFQRNPLIKGLFPPLQNLEDDELVKNPIFKGHASRFMQAVGAVVDNIDDYHETLSPLLNDLGRRHVSFKGFKPGYFNEFEEAILHVFAEDLGVKFTAQAREAWKNVFQFIMWELKRGYTQCLRDRGNVLPPTDDTTVNDTLSSVKEPTGSADTDDAADDRNGSHNHPPTGNGANDVGNNNHTNGTSYNDIEQPDG